LAAFLLSNFLIYKNMKRKRNAERICSVNPSKEMSWNNHAKKVSLTAWERAELWASRNQKVAFA
jgi:hypothetical protein